MENKPITEEEKIKVNLLNEEHKDYLFMVALTFVGALVMSVVCLLFIELVKIIE